MPALFYESYSKTYYASWCSLSTCTTIVLLVFMFILPFFAAFATDNFWTTISTYHEQPTVKFKNQFILHVLQEDDSYFYSSIVKLNDFYNNLLPVPLVKTQSIDTNYDDKTDLIKLKISFTSVPQAITNIKLMLFFEYALTSKVQIMMQTMCLVDIDTPNGASYVYTNGQINLQQKSPVSSGTITKSIYYTDVFQNSTSPFDFVSMYKEFASRNLTTTYNFDKIVMPYRSNSETELELDIIVPSYQSVQYIIPVMQTLKMAWVQYLCIWIPCAVIIYLFLYFIFKNRIFATTVISDIPKKYA